ncbi:unnamed protein product [Penicillium salamii]|uniref:Uncharacterized protein n=1 Tax=Penicillium salamii TaxID=1612424 RepID=A0A9W4JN18_9EURO|nr:unnamed protein product [Penicillium salamii]
MTMNLLSPEWALGKALADYGAVSGVAADFDELSEIDGVPWSRTHTYFVNMGGIAIHFDGSTSPASQVHSQYTRMEVPRRYSSETSLSRSISTTPNDSTPASAEPDRATLPPEVRISIDLSERHEQPSLRTISRARAAEWCIDETNSTSLSEAMLQSSDPEYFHNPWERWRFETRYWDWYYNLSALRGNVWVLDANQLLLARELGIIHRLPHISSDDIADRNKGDFVVKTIAVGQIIWFVIELLTRLRLRLPTSQLEVLTLSYAVCTAFTYGLLLDKPKDAAYSMVISATCYASPKEMNRLALAGPTHNGNSRRSIWIPNNTFHAIHTTRYTSGGHRIPKIQSFGFGLLYSSFIFGGIHFVACNFTFPSHIERLLWHISSIVTTAACPVAGIGEVLIAIICKALPPKAERNVEHLRVRLIDIVSKLIIVLFAIARIFIIVKLSWRPGRTISLTQGDGYLYLSLGFTAY